MLRVGAGGKGLGHSFIYSFIHFRSTHGYLLWVTKSYTCASQVLCPFDPTSLLDHPVRVDTFPPSFLVAWL